MPETARSNSYLWCDNCRRSFDHTEISGFYYPAPAKFTGRRPVLILSMHDNPEYVLEAVRSGAHADVIADLYVGEPDDSGERCPDGHAVELFTRAA